MSDSSPPTSNSNIGISPHNFLPDSFGRKDRRCATRKEEEESMKVVDGDATAIRRSVREINFGGLKEKVAAAVEIKRLAKANGKTRRLLAELGVIPGLVAMAVDSNGDRCQSSAIEALVEMANGVFRNKKLMVEAGLLSKLPQAMHKQSLTSDRQFAHLLFSISSLANTQFPIPMCHLLPFLVEILNAEELDDEVRLTCISTLHNLSTKLENIKPMATSGAVHSLIISSSNKMASERALATLGNLVLSSAGKKSIEDDPFVPKVFIDILLWDEKPKCQELATYLLMIVAHNSKLQRQRMVVLGIVPALLEVALLGSSLARKRALKLLEWFKDEKQMRMGAHSGPQPRRIALSSSNAGEENEDSRRAVKRMVKLSLDKNLELIMKRAGGLDDCPGFKVLVASSSSKSLPC